MRLQNAFAIPVLFCLVGFTGCDLFKEPTNPNAKAQAQAAPAEPEPPQMERVKAKVGVGKKGDSLRGENELIVGPAVAYFNAKEKIVFEIEIPRALNFFNAENGYYPKSHEEFMEKIIAFNQIKLPELKEGARYIYDPETHELMVERPVKNQPQQ